MILQRCFETFVGYPVVDLDPRRVRVTVRSVAPTVDIAAVLQDALASALRRPAAPLPTRASARPARVYLRGLLDPAELPRALHGAYQAALLHLPRPADQLPLPFRHPKRLRTLNPTKLTLRERNSWVELPDGWDADRPLNRGDCINGPRPCPWVSCAHHLYLWVDDKHGAIHLNHPGIAPDEMDRMRDTCVLDVADRQNGAEKRMPLEQVGRHLGMTLERARQLQQSALVKVREATANESFVDDVRDVPIDEDDHPDDEAVDDEDLFPITEDS